MDLLATILSGILVCGAVVVVVTVALYVLRAAGIRPSRRRKWSGHRAHVLTDTMVHYRANTRMMKDAVKLAG